MKHHCSVCGKTISQKLSMSKNLNNGYQEVICLSCIKEIDPIAYIFVLQSIERNLLNELENKEKEKDRLYKDLKSIQPIKKISA